VVFARAVLQIGRAHGAEKSRRDFIIQPGVDAMVAVRKHLRRETDHKMTSILKELNCRARNGDATALRKENILDD
jgi:hypothetical protein